MSQSSPYCDVRGGMVAARASKSHSVNVSCDSRGSRYDGSAYIGFASSLLDASGCMRDCVEAAKLLSCWRIRISKSASSSMIRADAMLLSTTLPRALRWALQDPFDPSPEGVWLGRRGRVSSATSLPRTPSTHANVRLVYAAARSNASLRSVLLGRLIARIFPNYVSVSK